MTMTDNTPGFPRADDGKGWAWGLTGDRPEKIWERFSPAYEAQAAEVVAALARLFGRSELDFAGSQDGEAAVALAPSGRALLLLHLEDPQLAQELAEARAEGRLDDWLRQARADDLAEAVVSGYVPDDEDRLIDLPPPNPPAPRIDDDEGLTFPRVDDGLGWAGGLSGDTPVEIWERFSPAYEAQAEAVLAAIDAAGYTAVLDWAGSEDGEVAIGLTEADEIAILLHLEDPAEAGLIQMALAQGRLDAFIREALI